MKPRYYIFLLIVTSNFFFSNLFSYADEPIVEVQTTSDSLIYNVSFPEPTLNSLEPNYAQLLQFQNILGELRQVEIPDCPLINDPGNPLLPRKLVTVVLPPERIIASVNIIYTQRVELPGTYTIPYALNPLPMSDDNLLATYPNLDIYNTNQDYPEELNSEIILQQKNGYTIAIGSINPVQYNPVTGKVYYYPQMTLILNLAESQEPALHQLFRGKLSDRQNVTNVIENQADLTFYDNFPVPVSSQISPLSQTQDEFDYVIITKADFVPSFEPLVMDKINRGIAATVVTTEWIYANYSGLRPSGGEDNQTKIRNFIIDAYTNWGIGYVLLGADADIEGQDNIVPARTLLGQGAIGQEPVAADMYYACLDNEQFLDIFDKDADGVYGEKYTQGSATIYEADFYFEVSIGRAPVDSKEEAYNFVMKSLNAISEDNFQHALMVGEDMSWPVWGSDFKEEINSVTCSTNGYKTYGFNEDWLVGTLYDTPTYHYDEYELYNKLDYGVFDPQIQQYCPISVINHMGHGSPYRILRLISLDLEIARGLGGIEYFLCYSQTCDAGMFNNDNSNNLDTDCISEKILGEPKGAFALVVNSSLGWGAPTTNGASQRFDRHFFSAYFSPNLFNPISELGLMNNYSKEHCVGLVSDSLIRHCYYDINLLGDPEIALDRIQDGRPHIGIYSQEDDRFTSFSKPLNLQMYLGNYSAFEPYQFNIEGLKEGSVGPCSWEITVEDLNLGNFPVQPGLLLSQYYGSGGAQITITFITTYTQPGTYSYKITVIDTTNNIVAGEKIININVKPARTILNVPAQYLTINQAVAAASVNNDSLILVAPGTYNEGTIDLAGKNIHLKSTGDPDSTTITGTIYAKYSGTDYPADHKVTIEGFTIDGNLQNRGIVSWCLDTNNNPNIPEIIIKNNIIKNCYTAENKGGGILLIRCLATISNNIIMNNSVNPSLSTQGSGGGLYFSPYYKVPPDIVYNGFPCWRIVMLERNLIYGNTAYKGAGVFIENIGLLRNNTIVSNTATYSGGGVQMLYLSDPAGQGPGGNVGSSGGDLEITYTESPNMINNIIWGNISQSGNPDINLYTNNFYTFSLYYNCTSYPSLISSPVKTIGNINEDPLLNNYYRLNLGSPCINAGAPKSLPDIDATPRDIGCYEYAIYVPQDYPTIAQAIDVIPDEGGTIYVDVGTYNEGPIYFGGKPIYLKSLNGAQATTIIGSIGLGDTAYQGVFSQNHQATIDGFTIDGNNTYGPGIEGVCSENNPNAYVAHITIKNNTIKNCINSSSGLGGGICLIRSQATVEWNTIYNNQAQKGAGIYFSEEYNTGYGLINFSSSDFKRNLIYNNTALYSAGGIYAKLLSPVLPPETALGFTNNTIVYNTANQCAGGIHLEGFGRFFFTNNIIWDNRDPLGSAQLYNRAQASPLAYFIDYNCLTYSGASPYSYIGNINTDPLLTASYQLQSNSPCIDTGDPASPLDPDYTQADMGVYYYPHTPMFPKVRAPNAGEEIGNGGG